MDAPVPSVPVPLFLGKKWGEGHGALVVVQAGGTAWCRVFAIQFDKKFGWQPNLSPTYYNASFISQHGGLQEMIKQANTMAQQEYPNG